MKTLKIATRKSPLALWQADYVKQRLVQIYRDLQVEIVGMTTQGDVLLDRSLAAVGGKGLFLKELEVSLLNDETDIAVHSMKDVPIRLPQGLEIAAVCSRENPRDAFVSNNYASLDELPAGARVGTSSLRRVSQLKHAFPHLDFVGLRGNVNTRLGKLDDGQYDAIILAAAGLIRLGFEQRITQYLVPELCLPAVGQGIVGIECRSKDKRTKSLLLPLHDIESALLLAAERGLNKTLEGGCQAPIAGYAEASKGVLRLRGMVAAEDGSQVLYSEKNSQEIDGTLSEELAEQLGEQVGQDLIEQGAKNLLDSAPSVSLTPPVVLLTRQQRYRGNSAQVLESLGCVVENFETLQIDPQLNETVLHHLQSLRRFTDVLFVSRNAVEIGMALMHDEGVSIPDSVNVMCVGAETAKQLKQYGITATFPNKGVGAEALLSADSMQDLSGRRILMVRGVHGLIWPSDEMKKRGAVVTHADVYQQQMPVHGAENLAKLLQQHIKIDGVFIHSAESATNFMQLVRGKLDRFVGCQMVVGSQRIADVVHQLGWPHDIETAESPSNKHMLKAYKGTQ